MHRARLAAWLLAMCPIFALTSPALAADDKPFALKNGDRVVFFGDSITDQRLYTTFIETYVVTRFPKMDVTFVHSGWSGDRVTGGGGGPIDTRLERDVFSYKPTVVTVMLGMNDAGVRAFDDKIFETYAKGYEHIVESVKEHIPGVRMTLVRPSPYDDVTREPKFDGGYNAVLVRYGDFIEKLAKKHDLDVADLNGPVVEATKKAFASDPKDAEKLNPDRIHPGLGGQLLMAAALLKDWHAPALVSRTEVKIEGDVLVVKGSHTNFEESSLSGGLPSWTQRDFVLPFPINLKDPVVDLAVRSSSVVQDLDEQPLKVIGLADGEYVLKIDGAAVGTFTSTQFEKGVNLAVLPTPMARQAAEVHQLTLAHNDLHWTRWRQLQVPLEKAEGKTRATLDAAIKALDGREAQLVRLQRLRAQPVMHRFEMAKKP